MANTYSTSPRQVWGSILGLHHTCSGYYSTAIGRNNTCYGHSTHSGYTLECSTNAPANPKVTITEYQPVSNGNFRPFGKEKKAL